MAQSKYKITRQQLIDIVGQYKTREFDEEIRAVEDLGGAEAIVEKLHSDKDNGITDEDLMDRQQYFGSNMREDLKAQSCFSMLLGALDDLMLKLLIVCSIVSITAEMILAWQQQNCEMAFAWIDGAAIMVAVVLVSGVGSSVDYKKELRFVEKRNASNNAKRVTVVRNGGTPLVKHPGELLVGDIVQITYGMAIPVDGLVLTGSQISADESAMTGESEEIRKAPQGECLERLHEALQQARETQKIKGQRKHELPSPILQSGTTIAQGEGTFICLMVGEDSCLGQIMASLEKRDEQTPLQEKLNEMAEDIGKLGTLFAILTFHVLMFRFILEGLLNRDVNLFGPVQETSVSTGHGSTKTSKKTKGDHAKVSSSSCPAHKKSVIHECPTKPDSEFVGGCTETGCIIKYLSEWFEFLIIAIVIIVVAVPEGLPLAVMISLAFSIGAMLQDDCDVKRLASCEIMGGADNVCSDKTGTLTNNKMETVRMWAGRDIEVPQSAQAATIDLENLGLASNTIDNLTTAIACNIPDKCGPTDKAMTGLLERAGKDILKIRAAHQCPEERFIRFPFTSGRKRMSTVTQNHGLGGYDKRLQIKGASEIVCVACTHYLDVNGVRQPRDDTVFQTVNDHIKTYAKEALRTVALAYKDINQGEHGDRHDEPVDEAVKNIEKEGFTLLAILGIEDTVRQEVPDAVSRIQAAGVTVRMVTGDNIDTARAIAVKCNIIGKEQLDDDEVCMEGPAFFDTVGGLKKVKLENGKEKEEVGNMRRFAQIEKKIRVLARSRPEDKYLMVTGLRQQGAVVAVTGDGTNDAPALKKADVGFGMGIAGTDVCLESADIIIVNDNFERIVRAAKWGRNVYDNIQRFLRFQLTVNFVALTVTFIGSAVMKQSPVNAIQLLWVNLIMDSLAAMALATGKPGDDLLQRAPQNRDDYLVSRRMVKHIMYGSIYQSIILCAVAFAGEYFIYEPSPIRQFEKAGKNNWTIYSGRNFEWGTKIPLYEKWHKPKEITYRQAFNEPNGLTTETFNYIYNWYATQYPNDCATGKNVDDMDRFLVFPGGASVQFTFFFNLFVLMQITNMISSRKIHDEWNIFEGIFTNSVFIIVWVVILGLQVLIIEFSSYIFQVTGLAWQQWLICLLTSFTLWIIDALVKLIPDRFTYAIGKDTVFDKRELAAGRQKESKFAGDD